MTHKTLSRLPLLAVTLTTGLAFSAGALAQPVTNPTAPPASATPGNPPQDTQAPATPGAGQARPGAVRLQSRAAPGGQAERPAPAERGGVAPGGMMPGTEAGSYPGMRSGATQQQGAGGSAAQTPSAPRTVNAPRAPSPAQSQAPVPTQGRPHRRAHRRPLRPSPPPRRRPRQHRPSSLTKPRCPSSSWVSRRAAERILVVSRPSAAAMAPPPLIMREVRLPATDIIGQTLHSVDGETVGQVVDVTFLPNGGGASHDLGAAGGFHALAIVEVGAFLGFDQRRVALRFTGLRRHARGNAIVLPESASSLRDRLELWAG